jgi:2'-hydroxyisoflavone reductase
VTAVRSADAQTTTEFRVRLLVLGGTLFVGRHVVESALERGHRVTTFTRGRTNPGLFPGVEALYGDRDGDLGALVGVALES